jgi:CheY-like chemotaxis protein
MCGGTVLETLQCMTTPVRECSSEPDHQVLVVDDHESLRSLLSAALRRKKLLIDTAGDGSETIELLARKRYRVLVLDLMMPVVTGWEVLDWIRTHQDRRPASVIILTATDRDVMQRLDPAVVNAIIFKPFDVFEVATYIQACCRAEVAADRRRKRLVGTPPV